MEQKQKTSMNAGKNAVVVVAPAPTRGRVFEGTITKRFPMRAVVEFERTVYVKKYQRFYKKKTRLHSRIPEGMNVVVGDYVRVRECRPLSKIIHSVVIEKVRSVEHAEGTK